MAVLNDADRQSVWQDLMDRLSRDREGIALSKTDLRAAVNAADQWVDDNAALYNSALPVSARTNLTASQKAELLVFVVSRRFVRGS